MIKAFLKSFTLHFAFILVFSGCATVVSKTAYPVYIHTDPAKANVTITDKKGKVVFKGVSPASLKLKSGAGYFSKAEYQVNISSPGFKEMTVPIHFKINAWYFGNILIGGLLGMLIIDPATGAMWKIKDPVVDETLVRDNLQAANRPALYII